MLTHLFGERGGGRGPTKDHLLAGHRGDHKGPWPDVRVAAKCRRVPYRPSNLSPVMPIKRSSHLAVWAD